MILNVDEKLLDLIADRKVCPHELRYEFGSYLIKLFGIRGDFLSICKDEDHIVLYFYLELEDENTIHGVIRGVSFSYDKIIKEAKCKACELQIVMK